MWPLAFAMMGRVYYFLPAGRWNSGLDSQEHILKNSPHLLARESLGSLPQTELRASYLSTHHHTNPIALYELGQRALEENTTMIASSFSDHFLVANTTVDNPAGSWRKVCMVWRVVTLLWASWGRLGILDRSIFYRDISPTHRLSLLIISVERFGKTGKMMRPSTITCLRHGAPSPPSPDEGDRPVEPEIHDYLLDYENSILWSYVGDIGDSVSTPARPELLPCAHWTTTPAPLHSRLRV